RPSRTQSSAASIPTTGRREPNDRPHRGCTHHPKRQERSSSGHTSCFWNRIATRERLPPRPSMTSSVNLRDNKTKTVAPGWLALAAGHAGGFGAAAEADHRPDAGGGAEGEDGEDAAPTQALDERGHQADGDGGEEEAEAGLHGHTGADVAAVRELAEPGAELGAISAHGETPYQAERREGEWIRKHEAREETTSPGDRETPDRHARAAQAVGEAPGDQAAEEADRNRAEAGEARAARAPARRLIETNQRRRHPGPHGVEPPHVAEVAEVDEPRRRLEQRPRREAPVEGRARVEVRAAAEGGGEHRGGGGGRGT